MTKQFLVVFSLMIFSAPAFAENAKPDTLGKFISLDSVRPARASGPMSLKPTGKFFRLGPRPAASGLPADAPKIVARFDMSKPALAKDLSPEERPAPPPGAKPEEAMDEEVARQLLSIYATTD